jgi:hypothetical protein
MIVSGLGSHIKFPLVTYFTLQQYLHTFSKSYHTNIILTQIRFLIYIGIPTCMIDKLNYILRGTYNLHDILHELYTLIKLYGRSTFI